jgi:TonB family protein
MALPLQFLQPEFSPGQGGAGMNRRLAIAGLGLALVLGESLAIAPKAPAQETSPESGKRKVKSRVVPEYPELARQMKVTGKVKIETTIAADGHVTNTRVVGGSPLLVTAATDAIKKWRFDPAAKETTEVIEFEFTGKE